MIKYYDYSLLILLLAILILRYISIYLDLQYSILIMYIARKLDKILIAGLYLRILLHIFIPKFINFLDGIKSLKNREHEIRKW